MIRLDRADQPIDRRVVATPGGFAWWYGEILDEHQNGVVLIWSFGLPFLPEYMSKIRKGRAETPCERAAVNIVTYKGGVPDFYLLHEFRPGDVSWDGRGSWRFGNTHFTSTDEGRHRVLDASIDIPMEGGGRLEGRLRFGGPIPQSTGTAGSSNHCWTPIISPCFGTVQLRERASDFSMRVSGRGYVDRNASPQDLESLGIERWLWAHTVGAAGDRIAYALWPNGGGAPSCYGFDIARDGTLQPRDVQVRVEGKYKRPFGMTSFRSIHFHTSGKPFIDAVLDTIVDDGPFYLRYLTEAGGMHGSAELIEPKRIDRLRHRPFVKMRVQSDIRKNSRWLPLFQGSKASQAQHRQSRLLPESVLRLLP